MVTEEMKIPSYSLVAGVAAKIKGSSAERMKPWKGHSDIYPNLAEQYRAQGL